MRQRGYMMTCGRCGKTEFVEKTSDGNGLGGWRALALERDDEPFDICPACAMLFDRIAEIFIKSFNGGILAYTPEGTPIIFDPTLLKPEEKSNEKSDEELKGSLIECVTITKKTTIDVYDIDEWKGTRKDDE
jgi:hypothetical protein